MNLPSRRHGATLVTMSLLALAATATATGTAAATGTATATARHASAAKAGGTVNVLYAASLENVFDAKIAPAFKRATGYTLEGFPAGSTALASEIKAKTQRGDVFISAAPSVNATLTGRRNGNWVSWYAPFATTELVLGYNPSSSFVHALKTQPWYDVVDRSGFRLGFTDPTLDPKGVLAVKALNSAAKAHGDSALATIATDQNDMFPEQSLVGDLQSGQLDAGFFYTVEANAAKIPTVKLGGIHETATYTITVLNRAPHAAAAAAFVQFLLGARGTKLLATAGLKHATPRVHGKRKAVPTVL